MKDKMKYLLIILVIGGLGYYAISSGKINLPGVPSLPGLPSQDNFLKVRLFDANGNPIDADPTLQSVVGGVPNSAYFVIDSTIINRGRVSLDASISNSNRPEVLAAYQKAFPTPIAIPQGSSYVFKFDKTCTSDLDCGVGSRCAPSNLCLLPAVTYEPLAQPVLFSVTGRGSFTCPIGETCATPSGNISGGQVGNIEKTGSISLQISPDPTSTADFDIIVTSSTGSQSGGTGGCLVTGTVCDPVVGGCCSGQCRGTTTESRTVVYTAINSSSTTNPSFLCPSGSVRCELLETAQAFYSGGYFCGTPYATPVLRAICEQSQTCSYSASNRHCYRGDSITTSTTYGCT